ncbi:HFL118Cp [Eremothecium sinecaudum]|uniref:HFL118Cp n=1 Tax=Eremothecium sinecaudum TaxID=45286 RepID=A0A109V0D5_9SACH|nr:HFL118Cp [Eremothecium sinecaudum]AMD21738.1 HFL118Cp [Eremothecium sinecaudum]
MSVWSFVVFWFYLSSFFIVGTITAAFVLPFMTASLFFATGVVICGFFSNLSFKSAQLMYDQFVGILQATLKNMADQVPIIDSGSNQNVTSGDLNTCSLCARMAEADISGSDRSDNYMMGHNDYSESPMVYELSGSPQIQELPDSSQIQELTETVESEGVDSNLQYEDSFQSPQIQEVPASPKIQELRESPQVEMLSRSSQEDIAESPEYSGYFEEQDEQKPVFKEYYSLDDEY